MNANSNSSIYCPPHLRPGFSQINHHPTVSGFNNQEPLKPPGNDELIKYISDAWNNVLKEYGKSAYYIDEELLENKT